MVQLPNTLWPALDYSFFMSLKHLLGRLRPATIAALHICSLFFVLPAILHSLDHPGERQPKTSMAQSSTHFAIADFDGDAQPDLAVIRVTRDAAPAAEYFLEVQLSSGSQTPIGIRGPAGGLQITPQDVNGDQIADLVVTSSMDAQFVAIFLNDGKGNFRQVKRSDYPDVGKRPVSQLISLPDSAVFQLTLGQNRSPDGNQIARARWDRAPENSLRLPTASVMSLQSILALAHSGRAPPFV